MSDTAPELKESGSLNQDTLEAMLVGYLIGDNDLDGSKWPAALKHANGGKKILESGIKPEWFENKTFGVMFKEFSEYYRANGVRMTPGDYREKHIGPGTPDEGNVWKDHADRCVSTLIAQGLQPDILIGRFNNRYFAKKAQKLFQEFQKDTGKETPEGLERYRKAIAEGLAPAKCKAKTYMLKDFVKKDTLPPERPDLIEGLVKTESKMFIGSASKAGKTWTLMDLAISLASGKPWWGRQIITPGPVLYYDLEMHLDSFCRRCEWIMRAKGLDPEDPGAIPGLEICQMRGLTTGLDAMLDDMLLKAKSKQYVAVIIDPQYKVLGDWDENAAGDMAALCNCYERISAEAKTTVIVSQHFSKGLAGIKDALSRISGSGVLIRDPDTILMVTPHKQEDCFVVEPTVRDLPPVEPFCVRWSAPLMRLDATLDPSEVKKKNDDDALLLGDKQVLDALKDRHWRTRPKCIEQIAALYHAPKTRAAFAFGALPQELLETEPGSTGKKFRLVENWQDVAKNLEKIDHAVVGEEGLMDNEM